METLGTVHGRQVDLEDAVPSMDGKRVRVRLEIVDEERELSPAEQTEAWHEWVASGPQGPIIDDADEWP